MTKEYEIQLKTWLAREDYTDGLRLWQQRYGENITYKMLCLGPNDFNKKKMREGLGEPLPPAPSPDRRGGASSRKPGKIAVLENTVGELGDTVDELESEVSDLSNEYSDLVDKTDDLGRDVESLEETVQDLAEKVEAFLRKVPVTSPLPPLLAGEGKKKTEVKENEPAEVRNWRKTTYGLMDERTLLKQRLRELADPVRRDDRKVTAFRILDITAELDRLFGLIGYYEEHARVPQALELEKLGISYPKRYLNLRTYVSRTRKKLARTTDPAGRASLEEKIRIWEEEMEQIDFEL